MLKTQLSKLLLLSFIIFCHISSILLPANAVMHSSYSANKNITAICSGNGKIRWIKLSEYYQTGKLAFIEPPGNTTNQKNNKDNTCQICSLYNQLDNVEDGLISNPFTINNIPTEMHVDSIAHFTKRNTLTPSSRDPPFAFLK